jgi:hypothetical protein
LRRLGDSLALCGNRNGESRRHKQCGKPGQPTSTATRCMALPP